MRGRSGCSSGLVTLESSGLQPFPGHRPSCLLMGYRDAGDLRRNASEWLGLMATGHSLGGALATLAAYDIRKQLLNNQQSNTQVVCYTFAAPRTGNHAFAREYNAAVPDTWSVINDQVSPLHCCSCSHEIRIGTTKQLHFLCYKPGVGQVAHEV